MDPSDAGVQPRDTLSRLRQEKECFLEEQLSQREQSLPGREHSGERQDANSSNGLSVGVILADIAKVMESLLWPVSRHELSH